MTPDTVDRLVRPVVQVYVNAEAAILTALARHLAAGIDTPGWADQKRRAAAGLRGEVDRLLARLGRDAAARVADMLRAARRLGAPGGTAPADPVDTTAAVATVTATHPRVRTWTTDVYQQVITEATDPVLAGDRTRRQSAQQALGRLTERGVTGYVDRAGRGWDLASYVEMATRTATAQEALAGQVERLLAQGIDLAIVSDAPAECALCRPWEGNVLSLTGAPAGPVQAADPRTGRPVTVRVAGSLATARTAGLFHPNCRHSLTAYLPGITRTPPGTADPGGDQARQRLRHLERQVRRWKRRQATALDPATAARASQKAREYQTQIRDHVQATTARRQPHRERLGAR